MLLQTNSYVVPSERRPDHARLLEQFRQTLARLGCHHFEVFEQIGANAGAAADGGTGRYVQIMRFRDRRHQLAVQTAERNDPSAQSLIAEFCELIDFPYQQEKGLFAVGFYSSTLPPIALQDDVDELEPLVLPPEEAEAMLEPELDLRLPDDLEQDAGGLLGENAALEALGAVPNPLNPGEPFTGTNGRPLPGQPGEDVLLEGIPENLEAEHDQTR